MFHWCCLCGLHLWLREKVTWWVLVCLVFHAIRCSALHHSVWNGLRSKKKKNHTLALFTVVKPYPCRCFELGCVRVFSRSQGLRFSRCWWRESLQRETRREKISERNKTKCIFDARSLVFLCLFAIFSLIKTHKYNIWTKGLEIIRLIILFLFLFETYSNL